MRISNTNRTAGRRRAFMLTEAMISIGIAGIALVSLYAGISQTFSAVQRTREDLRVTQILVERMEALRLVTWDELNTPGFVPATFLESLHGPAVDPTGTTGGAKTTGNQIVTTAGEELRESICRGRVQIDQVGVPAAYKGEMRHVTITVTWRRGAVVREQSMETFISEYGIQNYNF